ncbi:hypothetical protein BJ138DRAFT_1105449, partial [Hygrophoropsis aurantiaca]
MRDEITLLRGHCYRVTVMVRAIKVHDSAKLDGSYVWSVCGRLTPWCRCVKFLDYLTFEIAPLSSHSAKLNVQDFAYILFLPKIPRLRKPTQPMQMYSAISILFFLKVARNFRPVRNNCGVWLWRGTPMSDHRVLGDRRGRHRSLAIPGKASMQAHINGFSPYFYVTVPGGFENSGINAFADYLDVYCQRFPGRIQCRKKKDATPSRSSKPETRSHDGTMVVLPNAISAVDIAKELVPLDMGTGSWIQHQFQPTTPDTRSHDGTMTVLTNAISALDMAKELVPLDIAKGVLSTLSSILTVVKNTMQNKEDFAEIVSRCDQIANSIQRSTCGRFTSEIDPRITQALDELKSFVDGIEKTLKAKEQRALTTRAFSASRYSVRTLSNKIMKFYSIHPHPQNELIMHMAMKIDRISGAGTMERKSDEPDREPPPAQPPMLFGRDTLVQGVVESLSSQHVVLVGPGGIGKSSVAKTILNEGSIVARFNDRRFFVRFDDVNASQVTFDTFVGRIAKTLGV